MKTVEFIRINSKRDDYRCKCVVNHICQVDHSGAYVLASEANERIKALEAERDRLKERVFKLKGDHAAYYASIETLEAERDMLKEDLADMFGVGKVCLECQRKDERIKVLEDAAECGLSALKIASRQLTEDMKLVLNGKRWGGSDIDRLEKALGVKSSAKAALAEVKG